MCFVGVNPRGLDVDTATGSLYLTWSTKLKKFTKNDNSQADIYQATGRIYGIAIDQLNRYHTFWLHHACVKCSRLRLFVHQGVCIGLFIQ